MIKVKINVLVSTFIYFILLILYLQYGNKNYMELSFVMYWMSNVILVFYVSCYLSVLFYVLFKVEIEHKVFWVLVYVCIPIIAVSLFEKQNQSSAPKN